MALNPFFSLTAKYHRPSPSQLLVLIKKLEVDFNNNLLGFLLKDLESTIVNKSKNWSFLRYFDRFVCASHVSFAAEELVCICLFVFGMSLLERNDCALECFISSVLNARNPSVHRSWPVILLISLQFICKLSLSMSNPFWISVLQAMRSECLSSFALDLFTLEDCFTGTVIECSKDFKVLGQYDFEEDLSIERDAVITKLGSLFEQSGPFHDYIRKQDDEFQLGKNIADFALEKKPITSPPTDSAVPLVVKDNSKLDQDISGLQERLKELETKEVTSPKTAEIDVNRARFVIDTNALISNDDVIQAEMNDHPERFYVPLVVLVELEKLKSNSEREKLANMADEKLQPLLSSEKVLIVNNFGRILRNEEIKQQLEFLDFVIGNRVNDEVIIDTCRELSKFSPIVLLTDDVNMRLKAKTRHLDSVSVKEFRKLFHR